MKTRLKRALAGLATVAVAAGVAPVLLASPAAAAPPSAQAGAEIRNPGGSGLKQSGGGTNAGGFTLRLPTGATCPGDAVSGGWTWTAYMSLSSPTSFTGFDSNGPTPGGSGTSFSQALRDTSGNPIVGQAPNVGDGAIINIPNFSFSSFALGDFDTTVTRVYNVGIACVNSGALDKYWNIQMTVTPDTSAAGGTPQIHWENGTKPGAPTITGVTPATTNASTGQASVAFTNPAANPALTSCQISVGTSAGASDKLSNSPVSCTSPAVITGLNYGQAYFFRLTSTNSVGTSPVSNEVSATAIRPAVTGLAATPSPNTVALDWNDVGALLGSDSYNIAQCTLPASSPCTSTAAGYVATSTSSTSDKTFSGLAAGQSYAFTVTYGAAGTSGAASTSSTPLSNSIVLQDITVGRPNGALVLTQQCGRWDAMPAEPAQFGYPGGLGASAASATGAAPTGESAGGFAQYPYPENADGTPNATYPTTCGIALGNAHLITKGGAAMGAGQFFAADGRLNQVTVVDTRDTDNGWAVNFAMSALRNAAISTSISGNELGWTAQKTDTPSFLDGGGNSYDQTTAFTNASMTPNTQGTAGAGTAHEVMKALPGQGLGIATLDARIKLLIPIHARNGNYAGTLTINAL